MTKCLYYYDLVSIHAPAKGATYTIAGVCRNAIGFNPRAREGRDK